MSSKQKTDIIRRIQNFGSIATHPDNPYYGMNKRPDARVDLCTDIIRNVCCDNCLEKTNVYIFKAEKNFIEINKNYIKSDEIREYNDNLINELKTSNTLLKHAKIENKSQLEQINKLTYELKDISDNSSTDYNYYCHL